jgi:hypothetical protein
LKSGEKVLFSSAVDAQKQVQLLLEVLAKYEPTDNQGIIDVRFDQPVLKSN